MYILGIDIGGTKIAAGIIDSQAKVVSQLRCPTPASEGASAVLGAAINLGQQLVRSFDHSVLAIGIGSGGQIDASSGIVLSATDLLPGWTGTNIKAAFEDAFQVECSIENDVNALALGECRFGSATSLLGTIVFLALGTGVGGAIVIDGKVHHGHHWTGGELGHILLNFDENARTDFGGHHGTLEAYASGHGLVTTWRQITGNRGEITGEEIAAEAEHDTGGPAVLAVTQTGRYLGYGLVTIANMLDPALIVIGGGLSNLGDLLLDPARAVLKERALPGPSTCPVVTASLGADAGIIGAGAVALVERPGA